MERRNFLRLAGAAGAAFALPWPSLAQSRDDVGYYSYSFPLDPITSVESKVTTLLRTPEGRSQLMLSVTPSLRRSVDYIGLARRTMRCITDKRIFRNAAGRKVTVPMFPIEASITLPKFSPQRYDLFVHALHLLKADIVAQEDTFLFDRGNAVAKAAASDSKGFKPREISDKGDLLAEAVRDIHGSAGMQVTRILVNPRDYLQMLRSSGPGYERNCQRITLKTGFMGVYGNAQVIQSRNVEYGTVWAFALRDNQPEDRSDLIFTTKEPLTFRCYDHDDDMVITAEESVGMLV